MNLGKREKVMLIGGGTVVLVITLWFFVFNPYLNRMDTLSKNVMAFETQLEEMKSRSASYLQMQGKVEEVQAIVSSRSGNFELYSHVSGLAQDLGLEENCELKTSSGTRTRGSRFRREGVHVTFGDDSPASMEELTKLLYAIYSSVEPNGYPALLVIDNITVSRNSAKKKGIRAEFLVTTPGLV